MIWGKKRDGGPFFRAADLKKERKFHARFCGDCFLNEELSINYPKGRRILIQRWLIFCHKVKVLSKYF